jgi:hypothetical protein
MIYRRATKVAVKAGMTISDGFLQEFCLYILTKSPIGETAITPPGLSY